MRADIIANETDGAEVAAVFDVNDAAAAQVADALRVPVMSIDEILESDFVDAVAICSSTDTHVELITRAAAAGKATFCEKPISLDISEVDKALSAVREHGVAFMVGFNRRFDPTHAAVQEAVASGRVGDPHIARISSRDPAPPPVEYIKVSGGIFVDMMIHDFDMARFVVGSPVTEVYATGAVRIDPAIGEAGDLDTAVVTLTHANGCITTIDNSRQAVSATSVSGTRIHRHGSVGESDEGRSGLQRWRTAEAFCPSSLTDTTTVTAREWQAFVRYAREGGRRRSADRTAVPVAIESRPGVLSFGDSRHTLRRLIAENDAHARHGFPIQPFASMREAWAEQQDTRRWIIAGCPPSA